MQKQTLYLRIAAGLGASAVIIGAFGAHGLEERLTPELLETYETGVKYHFYHTLAILAIALTSPTLWKSSLTLWACRMFTAGIILFSGSLYILAITDTPKLGAITPFGGLAMIAGWICIAIAAGKSAS